MRDDRDDLRRTIEELAAELEGLDYRDLEQRMRLSWRLAWLKTLEATQRLVRSPDVSPPQQLRAIFRGLSRNILEAGRNSRDWLQRWIPRAMKAGMGQADMQMQAQSTMVRGDFAVVNDRAVALMVRDGMTDLLRNAQIAEQNTKRRIQRVVKEELEDLVVTGKRASGKKIAERLAEEQIFGIEAKNGRWMPMEEYARIVAHTKLREAHTTGVEQLITDNGFDLVRISSHVHKPDLCTPIEGKVFSLSGRDTRFPKLPRHTPFHIGCRHVETPFIDRYYTEAELDEFRRQSNSDKPINVYSKEQLEAVDKRRRRRVKKRLVERQVETKNEEALAKKKKTLRQALKQEQSL